MRFEKRLIVTAGPPKAIGVLTTLTRSPLDKRALTIGCFHPDDGQEEQGYDLQP